MVGGRGGGYGTKWLSIIAKARNGTLSNLPSHSGLET